MKALLAKILEVQKEIQPIIKDATNPYYSSKYFDVNTVIGELKPLLIKHGLVVMQPLDTGPAGYPALRTMISDSETGASMGFDTPLIQLQDPQKMGAVISYFRRYALVSLFLLQGEIDDDGNSAMPAPIKKPIAKPAQIAKAIPQPELPIIQQETPWEKGEDSYLPEPVIEPMTCELCGSKMVERKSTKGPFLGCSAYPKCRNTHSL